MTLSMIKSILSPCPESPALLKFLKSDSEVKHFLCLLGSTLLIVFILSVPSLAIFLLKLFLYPFFLQEVSLLWCRKANCIRIYKGSAFYVGPNWEGVSSSKGLEASVVPGEASYEKGQDGDTRPWGKETGKQYHASHMMCVASRKWAKRK